MAYIFFDIDGTLWDEKMQIPESTIPTIRQLQKNGLLSRHTTLRRRKWHDLDELSGSYGLV